MKYSSFLAFLGLLICVHGCDGPIDVGQDPVQIFKASPKAIGKQDVMTLKIGEKAPDFNLPDSKGIMRSLDDYNDADVLAIIFTCNHCPTAQAYEDRIIQVANDYDEKSFQMLAITPNSPLGLLLNELGYSDLNDDFSAMQSRVDYKEYNFPYLYDGDEHQASLKYGPVATPHAFVFNKERELIYVGRLDASEKPGSANAEDLRQAIDAGLRGNSPEISQTKTFGCSTKWAWKTEYVEKDSLGWASRPVRLEEVDNAGIAALKKNTSGKLRLINIWATWCGPCVQEYPSFIEIQRMYGGRDFEFVSISADKAKTRSKALEFLKKQQSAVANYVYNSDDVYELVEAVDPAWNGALPYTMLIDPNGEKVWSQQGTVDFLALKRKIVEHPLIGRYY